MKLQLYIFFSNLKEMHIRLLSLRQYFNFFRFSIIKYISNNVIKYDVSHDNWFD